EAAVSQFYTISPNWFQTLGIPVLQGRSFLPKDTAESQRVLVVNASFARHYFPNADPIGKRINTGWKNQPLWAEIIGVVGDIRHQDLETAPKPAAYASYVQSPWPAMMLVVKTENDPKGLVNSLRTAIASVDQAQPLFDIQTLDERVLKASAVQQFNMLVLTVFAGVALLLATIGIYGVVAYSVGRRRREIGIRLALGAQKSHIFQMVLGYGLTLCAIGMVLGLAGAFGLTRFVSSLLYAVSPTDQLTFVAISGILLAVSLVACLVPVRRALNVDPVETLRTE
ncbi:MAG TPA: FtsX-like permease family protein, partial [Acidobacteriota bacterium]|nr:FtsX-like permease family protein [Acidobacteriota bacterium]